jgi:hypothetical protein
MITLSAAIFSNTCLKQKQKKLTNSNVLIFKQTYLGSNELFFRFHLIFFFAFTNDYKIIKTNLMDNE